jgi:hypothetical protein
MAPLLLLRALATGLSAVYLLSQPAGAALLPPPPADDPFYAAPANIASEKPGTVLRSREVTVAAFAALPQKVQHAWQVLYRTTSAIGEPQATVTTLLVPFNASTAPVKLLSYQVAEDSPSGQCAPSYQLRLALETEISCSRQRFCSSTLPCKKGGPSLFPITKVRGHGQAIGQSKAILTLLLLPFFSGPKSAYPAGIQPGQGVLDGIRASLALPAASLDASTTRIGLLGYSGGALASAWASELQPSYAPELHIVGVAEGGVPVNVGHVLEKVNKGMSLAAVCLKNTI